jgi:hypothetical protein
VCAAKPPIRLDERTGACAGQHGEHRLGHVRHDDDAFALLHAEEPHRRELVHFPVQFAIGQRAFDAGLGGYRDDCRLFAALGQMPVDRVVAQIRFAAGEPLAKRWIRILENLLRRLVPMDQPCLNGPEFLGLLDRAAIFVFVAHCHTSARYRQAKGRVSPCRDDFGRKKRPLLDPGQA